MAMLVYVFGAFITLSGAIMTRNSDDSLSWVGAVVFGLGCYVSHLSGHLAAEENERCL